MAKKTLLQEELERQDGETFSEHSKRIMAKQKQILEPFPGTGNIRDVPLTQDPGETVSDLELRRETTRQRQIVALEDTDPLRMLGLGEAGDKAADLFARARFDSLTLPNEGRQPKDKDIHALRARLEALGDRGNFEEAAKTQFAKFGETKERVAGQKGRRSKQNIQLQGRRSTILTSPAGILGGTLLNGG